MLPSSQTNANRSTSGSTTIPKSACSLTTNLDISVKFSGKGSGLWGKSPFGSQNNLMHSTPILSNNLGIIKPPVEFTASTTTLNPKEWNALKLLNGEGEFLSEKDGEKILLLAENDDFSLSWDNYPTEDATKSPCIDAGTPDIDMDGNDDMENYIGTAPDIGLFEFEESGCGIAGDMNMDGSINILDIVMLVNTILGA